MYIALLVVHILVCLLLIAVVLMQSGKGGGLVGGAFGGTAQTVFGGRGATDVMTRATMVLGGLFFALSLVLGLMTTGTQRASRSLMQEEARRQQSAAPRVPSATPGGAAVPAAPAPAAPAPAPAGGGR
jgi:preprotein translocase subunit SecG